MVRARISGNKSIFVCVCRIINTDVREGRGISITNDGTRFEGYFVRNRVNGRGRVIFPDGTVVEGMLVDDRAHGYAVLVDPNGYRYFGMWRNGLKHGQGVESWLEGTSY
jgi:hypothetical protein